MTRSRSLSPVARRVLAALARAGTAGRHGYDLCAETGVKSGTLYPLLIRLEGQGYLVADWEASVVPGRPPRHIYRLTGAGRELVAENPVIDKAEGILPAGGRA